MKSNQMKKAKSKILKNYRIKREKKEKEVVKVKKKLISKKKIKETRK